MSPVYMRDRDREGPMQTAARFAESYPDRPTDMFPLSPAADLLREVLAAAPHMPDEDHYGEDVPGMSKEEYSWPDYYLTYEWGSEYLDRLFTALIEVIESNGHDGWRSVRWEVYDKVRSTFAIHSYT